MAFHLAQELAKDGIKEQNPNIWFEEYYSKQSDLSKIPWAKLEPNRHLLEFLQKHQNIKKALVIGCGLGDDAEAISHFAKETFAFDISKSAVNRAKERFSDSKVDYKVMDLLNLDESFFKEFDFIYEAFTLQSIPEHVRDGAFENISKLLTPNGKLLVIAHKRDKELKPFDLPPFFLTKSELDKFLDFDLKEESINEFKNGDRVEFVIEYKSR